jgi:hypothetical protein
MNIWIAFLIPCQQTGGQRARQNQNHGLTRSHTQPAVQDKMKRGEQKPNFPLGNPKRGRTHLSHGESEANPTGAAASALSNAHNQHGHTNHPGGGAGQRGRPPSSGGVAVARRGAARKRRREKDGLIRDGGFLLDSGTFLGWLLRSWAKERGRVLSGESESERGGRSQGVDLASRAAVTGRGFAGLGWGLGEERWVRQRGGPRSGELDYCWWAYWIPIKAIKMSTWRVCRLYLTKVWTPSERPSSQTFSDS